MASARRPSSSPTASSRRGARRSGRSSNRSAATAAEPRLGHERAIRAELDSVGARLLDLQAEFDGIVAAAAECSTDDEHDAEGSTLGYERARVRALLDAALVRRAALLDALSARSSAPGTCSGCGAPIPLERLLALPETTTCAACAAPKGDLLARGTKGRGRGR